jgi:hypothetical protein
MADRTRSPRPEPDLRWLPAAALAGCLLLTGCAGAPGFVTPLEASLPAGETLLPEAESTQAAIALAEKPAPPTGGYPAPEESAPASQAQAKAATAVPGSFAMYLPVIANQMPSSYPFELKSSGVVAIQGMNGCDWAGVAGLVFDLSGAPLQNLILHLEGTWNGQSIALEALSGSTPDPYGPSGYEFVLGDQPQTTSQALWIQVRDATGKQISERVYFNTQDDCGHNLVLIDFKQMR